MELIFASAPAPWSAASAAPPLADLYGCGGYQEWASSCLPFTDRRVATPRGVPLGGGECGTQAYQACVVVLRWSEGREGRKAFEALLFVD